jgi:hypothetical protein
MQERRGVKYSPVVVAVVGVTCWELQCGRDLGNICRLSTNVWLPVYYVARLLTTGFSMTVALIMTSTARQALYSNLAQQFSCM